jgi:hypothetical protein
MSMLKYLLKTECASALSRNNQRPVTQLVAYLATDILRCLGGVSVRVFEMVPHSALTHR